MLQEFYARFVAQFSFVLGIIAAPCAVVAVLGLIGYIAYIIGDLVWEWNRALHDWGTEGQLVHERKMHADLLVNFRAQRERNEYDYEAAKAYKDKIQKEAKGKERAAYADALVFAASCIGNKPLSDRLVGHTFEVIKPRNTHEWAVFLHDLSKQVRAGTAQMP